eukprot:Phypoly_transcript_22075.p3 GENE.Phypoly_transcript_22075~~Phypoly_transcript_22075.p3  ORF type:complete len:102 (+),score=18.84 Phypoly_transcript_22075:295-600(+)
MGEDRTKMVPFRISLRFVNERARTRICTNERTKYEFANQKVVTKRKTGIHAGAAEGRNRYKEAVDSADGIHKIISLLEHQIVNVSTQAARVLSFFGTDAHA